MIRPNPDSYSSEPAKVQAVVWGRYYDNNELFQLFGVSDYDSLLQKLTDWHCDRSGMPQKTRVVVCHTDDLVVRGIVLSR
jgi:hypothetical protein